ASKTRGDLVAAGLDIGRIAGALGSTAPVASGVLGGRLGWSGDLEREVRFKLGLDALPRARGLGATSLHGEAEGQAHPRERRLDAAWNARIEAQGESGSTLEQLQVAAEGSLRGAASLSYEGHASAIVGLRLPAATRDLSLELQASGDADHLTARG